MPFIRFGSKVIVQRGSPGNPPGTKGCLRSVKGVLLKRRGHNCLVKLTQDDPLSTFPDLSLTGHNGWWSESVVTEDLTA